MVRALLDTSILVDILRGHPPAATWVRALAQPSCGITPPVWMELMAGVTNKASQSQAARLLSQFEMTYLTRQDMDWAMQQQLIYQLSHGVGILDCLIASTSHRLQVPLYTLNLKHFASLLGPLAQRPY